MKALCHKLLADFVGVTSEDVFAGDESYRTTNLSAQSAAGVTLIRQTFVWTQIETSLGVYDLSYHDAYVTKAAARSGARGRHYPRHRRL